MDPDVALEELREMVARCNRGCTAGGYGAEPITLEDFAEKFEALDQWMTSGGFAPRGWRKHEVNDD